MWRRRSSRSACSRPPTPRPPHACDGAWAGKAAAPAAAAACAQGDSEQCKSLVSSPTASSVARLRRQALALLLAVDGGEEPVHRQVGAGAEHRTARWAACVQQRNPLLRCSFQAGKRGCETIIARGKRGCWAKTSRVSEAVRLQISRPCFTSCPGQHVSPLKGQA